MTDDAAGKSPVRIELATSEIESGPCRAWADPVQVMAAVAISVPNDSFGFYVEPRLDELSGMPTEGATGELPVLVRDLVDRLQQVHARLYRDNCAGLDGSSRSVRVTCAVGEEDRVYFVKASSTWVGLLREGVTHPVEEVAGAETKHAGLGGSEKLGLDVTSLPVEPDDIVVMLAAEEGTAPDLRAVASVFSQTHDLKRACDGLVNLLGLQSEGAAAVAFRFVPIANTSSSNESNPIESLTAEFDRGAVLSLFKPEDTSASPSTPEATTIETESSNEGDTAIPPTSDEPLVTEAELPSTLPPQPTADASLILDGSSHGPAEPDPRFDTTPFAEGSEAASFLDSLGRGEPDAEVFSGDVGSQPNSGTDSLSGDATPGDPAVVANASGSVGGESMSSVDPPVDPAEVRDVAPEPTSPVTSEPVETMGDTASEDGVPTDATANRPARPPETPRAPELALAGGAHRKNLLWPVLIAVVIGLVVGLAAVPGGGLKSLFGDKVPTQGPSGELIVEPDPPAKAVFIDGQPVAEGTPAHFPELAVGKHTVRFDLGACGMWETEVEVIEGESLRCAPKITGSVSVTVANPARSGKAWVDGREQQSLPVVIDDLPVGWNRIFYEDAKLPIWDQQVLVRSDQVASLVVPNNLRKGEGLFRIESLTYVEGRGLTESPRDSVFIDDRWSGLTPLESRVEPGLHSVRIRSKAGEVHTEMLEVHSAGTRYVVAQFGMSSHPSLIHRAPGRVEPQGSLVLTVEVDSKAGEEVSRATLHFPDLDSASREIQLSKVDESRPVYVGIFDPRKLPVSRDVRYYFTVQNGAGETTFSDLYTLVVGRKGSTSRIKRRKKTPPATPKGQVAAPAVPQEIPVAVTIPMPEVPAPAAATAPAAVSREIGTAVVPPSGSAVPPVTPAVIPPGLSVGADGVTPLEPGALVPGEEVSPDPSPESVLGLDLEIAPPKPEVTIRK